MTNLKNQIQIALNKHLVIPVYVLAILGLFGWLRGCSASSESQKARKEVTTLSTEIDSLEKVISKLPTLDQIRTEVEIEGFKISKRTLYDQNAIVRTTLRPDDRMNEYDQEIEKLRNK
jgi:hypothetical protein